MATFSCILRNFLTMSGRSEFPVCFLKECCNYSLLDIENEVRILHPFPAKSEVHHAHPFPLPNGIGY